MFVLYLYLSMLALFCLGKVVFLLMVGSDVTVVDYLQVIGHGLVQDASMTGYLILLPGLLTLVATWYKRLPLRHILTPYYAIAALMISVIWVVDCGLYPFWGFKLDTTIFNYIDSPGDALASVSLWFVIWHTLLMLLLTVGITYLWMRLTPLHYEVEKPHRWSQMKRKIFFSIILFLSMAVQPIIMRGGLNTSTMNPGFVYFSDRQLLNHGAVNPTFNLMYSIGLNERFDQMYRYVDDKRCLQLTSELYPTDTEDITDTLLTTRRPNVLLIIMEGMGGMFYPETGGPADVTPNLQRYSKQGVWFDEYYNNSFRTDRGVLSALSGTVGFPSLSLMKMTQCEMLPSVARSLQGAGYNTSFWYGGDINFTNMYGYLKSTGYERAYSMDDFTLKEQESGGKWGVTDSIFLDRVWQQMQGQFSHPKQFLTLLTLSSHEPFDVPYHRLDDHELNAFAYTDHEVGRLLDRLRQSPLWKDLLVIIMPDHGFTLGNIQEYEDRFFHARMIWTGGAIREARKVETLMNQSDMAATLLSQMGIRHKDFPWSRNVFSRNYRHPFAYCSFVDGFLVRDSTGISIFDNIGKRTIDETQNPSKQRIEMGQATLQHSYDWVQQLSHPTDKK